MTVFTKNGKLTAETRKAFVEALNSDGKIYTYYTSGRFSRRRYCETDVRKAMRNGAFDYFGIAYKLKNDAPRGGKRGEYIEVSEQSKRRIEMILKAYEA